MNLLVKLMLSIKCKDHMQHQFVGNLIAGNIFRLHFIHTHYETVRVLKIVQLSLHSLSILNISSNFMFESLTFYFKKIKFELEIYLNYLHLIHWL